MTSTTTRLQIVCAADLPEDLALFIQKVPAIFSREGTVIYNARNQIRIFDVEGRSVNVKKFCIPPMGNRLLYSFGLRTPKAKAAYHHALTLQEHGVHTPRPYGYILEKKEGLLTHAYLVTEQLTEYQTLGYKDTPKILIRQLARYIAQLHENGLLHRDLTPNNVLFKNEGGEYRFSLVDVNRFIIRKKPISIAEALPYLIQLFLERKELLHFITAYAYCRKADPKYCYRTALQLRGGRTAYSRLKKLLKKIPGAHLFQTERLDTHHK